MTNKIEQVSRFVHDYLMKSGKDHLDETWGPKYRWEHTLRVSHWAHQLADEAKADVETCVISALFHDVSHFTSEEYRKHGIESAEIARNYLKKKDYSQAFTDKVAYAIKSHVGEFHPKTIEAKILQDADTLDRFGFVRILLFGKKAELTDLKKLKEQVQSFLNYLERAEKGDFGSMWTKTGEDELAKLVKMNKAICNGVLKELEDTKSLEKNLKRHRYQLTINNL